MKFFFFLLFGALGLYAEPDNYSWSVPTTVYSSSGVNAISPKLALHASNQSAILSWVDYSSGIYTTRAGSFNGVSWSVGPSFTSSTAVPTTQVGIDSSGKGLAIWDNINGVLLSIRSSRFDGANWSEPVLVTATDSAYSCFPQLAVNSLGNAVCIWQDQLARILLARDFNATSNSWGNQYGLKVSSVNLSAVPSLVGLNTSNVANVIMFAQQGVYGASYQALTSKPSATFSSLENFATNVAPQISVNPNDGAILWVAQSSSGGNLKSGRKLEGGTWSLAQIVNMTSFVVSSLSIALDRVTDGAVAAWQTTGGSIQVSLYNGDSWTAPQELSTNGASPTVAVNGQNNHAVVAWVDLTAGGTSNTIKVSEYGSSWSSPSSISATSSTLQSPCIAINDNGFALVVWSRLVGSNQVLEMATSSN